MEFRAGATGAGLTHHPEVVLFVSVNDVDGRIEAGSFKFRSPEAPCLLVAGGGVAGCGVVDGRVEAGCREFPAVNDQFPCPVDGFLFKIVTKRPIPEHFEECVVVGIEADIIEIIVFPSGADAFLSIGSAQVRTGDGSRPLRCVRRFLSQEEGNELVHARIREKQVWRIRHEAR